MRKNIKTKTVYKRLMWLTVLAVLSGCSGLIKGPGEAVRNEEDREMMRIKRFEENVKRDGGTLYLKTGSRAYLTYKDLEHCVPMSPCDYEFIDYWSDPGFYVVLVGYHEGEDYLIISDTDGKEYRVYSLPRLSPDKKLIVTAFGNEAGYTVSGVFIWRIVGGGLVSEYSYRPNQYALYGFVEWKDHKTVRLVKVVYSTEELCPGTNIMTIPVNLRLEDGEWRFQDDITSRAVKCGSDQIDFSPFR